MLFSPAKLVSNPLFLHLSVSSLIWKSWLIVFKLRIFNVTYLDNPCSSYNKKNNLQIHFCIQSKIHVDFSIGHSSFHPCTGHCQPRRPIYQQTRKRANSSHLQEEAENYTSLSCNGWSHGRMLWLSTAIG